MPFLLGPLDNCTFETTLPIPGNIYLFIELNDRENSASRLIKAGRCYTFIWYAWVMSVYGAV